jgi:hypothetical protein
MSLGLFPPQARAGFVGSRMGRPCLVPAPGCSGPSHTVRAGGPPVDTVNRTEQNKYLPHFVPSTQANHEAVWGSFGQ